LSRAGSGSTEPAEPRMRPTGRSGAESRSGAAHLWHAAERRLVRAAPEGPQLMRISLGGHKVDPLPRRTSAYDKTEISRTKEHQEGRQGRQSNEDHFPVAEEDPHCARQAGCQGSQAEAALRPRCRLAAIAADSPGRPGPSPPLRLSEVRCRTISTRPLSSWALQRLVSRTRSGTQS